MEAFLFYAPRNTFGNCLLRCAGGFILVYFESSAFGGGASARRYHAGYHRGDCILADTLGFSAGAHHAFACF
jgi:hypothetical protein